MNHYAAAGRGHPGRPSPLGLLAPGRPAVADADEHDVALVALHIFEVLDEEGLGRADREELLGRRVVAAEPLQVLLDRLALGHAEGGDAKRQAPVRGTTQLLRCA